MSNEELQDAIEKAHTGLKTTGIGNELYNWNLEHIDKLLKIQAQRASYSTISD